MEKKLIQVLIVPVALLSLIFGVIGGGGGFYLYNKYFADASSGQVAVPATTNNVYVEQSSLISAIEKVSPSVVSISVSKNITSNSTLDPFFNDPFFEQFFGKRSDGGSVQPQYKRIGGGSGFIVTGDGLVLTNKHVVSDDSADYTIVAKDGTEYAGKVVSLDPLNDLAVVQMYVVSDVAEKKADGEKVSAPNYDFTKMSKPKDLPKVEIGSSADLKVGQYVLAIGNALAEFDNTVTFGIISAKSRDITASGGMGSSAENLSGLLQTDAPINPGNSGGPLVNLAGQVVGVNVAMAQSANSIGFALPIDDVKPVLDSVSQYGEIVRPVIGVRYMMLDKQKAKELMLKVDHGALLVGDEAKGEFAVIPGGPADKAGLKIKDVILSIDGEDVTVDKPLTDYVMKHKPDDTVTLKVWRSGETIDVNVKLGSSKDFKRD